jgi:hypothetical protein
MGPRGKGQAQPFIKLVLGQPALHERGLEQVNSAISIGVGCPETAAARRGPRDLVTMACYHRRLLAAHNAKAA